MFLGRSLSSIGRSDNERRQETPNNPHGQSLTPAEIGLNARSDIKSPPPSYQASQQAAIQHEPHENITRGRTMERTPRIANPLGKAESRARHKDASIELNVHPIEKRLSRSSVLFRDPNDPCAALDDEFLEPCPRWHAPHVAQMLEEADANDTNTAHDADPIPPHPSFVRAKSDMNWVDPFGETSSISTQPSHTPRRLDSDPNTGRPSGSSFVSRHSSGRNPSSLDTLPFQLPRPLLSEYDSSLTLHSPSPHNQVGQRSSVAVEPSHSPRHGLSDVDLPQTLHAAPTLTSELLARYFPEIPRHEYFSLKSSSPMWSSSVTRVSVEESLAPGGLPSAASQLPAEILREIYIHLCPVDFNAARHVSRSWYIGSLDRSLLETMLKRGGWSSSITIELAANHTLDARIRANDEWLMSKAISRQCALGPDWTGHGIEPTALAESEPGKNTSRTAFVLCSRTDFSELSLHHIGSAEGERGENAGLLFTVSTCGKFAIVAHGCLVYVYELNRSHRRVYGMALDDQIIPGAVRPITSIVCPRRVLACSMDTSSNRDAIGVLMDGRMGLVCAVTGNSRRSRRLSMLRNKRIATLRAQGMRLTRDNLLRRETHETIQLEKIPKTKKEIKEEKRRVKAAAKGKRAARDSAKDSGPASPSLSASPSPRESRSTEGGSPVPQSPFFTMPVENCTPTLYAPLCSADDPPRSVALCPQRRCIAFGCSSGIELHWVDALTGQDLNRWFPLTAPSDHLYFLPPRAGVDSPKKLRLISSVSRPDERSTIAMRFGGNSTGASIEPNESEIGNSIFSPFWRRLADRYDSGWLSSHANPSSTLRFTTGSDRGDHYRAIPLSDGYHLLFTDPATGYLFLGSDAPIGGQTKLLRKICFVGPPPPPPPPPLPLSSASAQKEQSHPLYPLITYAVGSELTWGVSVIAAYGTGSEQRLWYFNVPSDVLAESLAEQSNNGANVLSGLGNAGFGLGIDASSSSVPLSSASAAATAGVHHRRESLTRNQEWKVWLTISHGDHGHIDGQQETSDMQTTTMDDDLSHQGAWASSSSERSHPSSIWPLRIRGQEIGTCRNLVDLAICSGPKMAIWAFQRDGVALTWRLAGADDGGVEMLPMKRIVARDGTVRGVDGEGDVEMGGVGVGDTATGSLPSGGLSSSILVPGPLAPSGIGGSSGVGTAVASHEAGARSFDGAASIAPVAGSGHAAPDGGEVRRNALIAPEEDEDMKSRDGSEASSIRSSVFRSYDEDGDNGQENSYAYDDPSNYDHDPDEVLDNTHSRNHREDITDPSSTDETGNNSFDQVALAHTTGDILYHTRRFVARSFVEEVSWGTHVRPMSAEAEAEEEDGEVTGWGLMMGGGLEGLGLGLGIRRSSDVVEELAGTGLARIDVEIR